MRETDTASRGDQMRDVWEGGGRYNRRDKSPKRAIRRDGHLAECLTGGGASYHPSSVRWAHDRSCARRARELVCECNATLCLAAPRHPLDAHRLVTRATPTPLPPHHHNRMASSSMLDLVCTRPQNARVAGSYTAANTSESRLQVRTAHTSALSPAHTRLFIPTRE